MNRRSLAVLAAAAMVLSVAAAVPARADAPELPADPNIVDDQGDAATGSSQGDLWHAWFSEDGPDISFHFNSAAPPPPAAYGTEWRIYASPNADGTECFLLRAQVPAGAYVGDAIARIFDVCEVGSNWFDHPVAEAPVEYGEMADGSGYIQTTFEKSAVSYINDGAIIASPRAQAHFLMGAQAGGFNAPLVDDTEVGSDYAVGGEPTASEPKNEDPGKKDEAPVKNGCKKKKGKGKKKGCDKGEGPKEEPKASCDAYVPGELGAEAESFVVTDEHTADAPLEITMEHGPAVAGGSDVYSNIQVDSEAAEAGLYISYDFPVYEDHDLYVYYADGAEAAAVGGFNPAPVPVALGCCDGTGSGGHSEQGAEILDGLRTADCGGWTVEWHGYLAEGGEYTATVWLGEIQNDPAPPA